MSDSKDPPSKWSSLSSTTRVEWEYVRDLEEFLRECESMPDGTTVYFSFQGAELPESFSAIVPDEFLERLSQRYLDVVVSVLEFVELLRCDGKPFTLMVYRHSPNVLWAQKHIAKLEDACNAHRL